MRNWKVGLVVTLVIITIICVIVFITRNSEDASNEFSSNSNPNTVALDRNEQVEDITPTSNNSISIDYLCANRESKESIRIFWADSLDDEVSMYSVERKPTNKTESSWTEVASFKSDGIVDGENIEYVDEVGTEPQQFLYRVQISVVDEENWTVEDGVPVIASNFLVCIDPGHYGNNKATASGYVEGRVTLKIGHELQEHLKEVYGIDSYLTRTGENISLGGYNNEELDKAHLTLRGSYAGERDSNLFLSLHTNANLSNANGYPTESQPISINKPVLIASQMTGYNPVGVSIANEIGTELANVNYSKGLATISTFDTIIPGAMSEWTDEYNDSLNTPGTVFDRLQDNGEEYYGVLRGATESGVMGLIIEHGMHTVPEVRTAISEGDLIFLWAQADAKGLAEGLGFVEYGDLVY